MQGILQDKGAEEGNPYSLKLYQRNTIIFVAIGDYYCDCVINPLAQL